MERKFEGDKQIVDTRVKIELYLYGGGKAIKESNLFDAKEIINKLDNACATGLDFELDDEWVIIK